MASDEGRGPMGCVRQHGRQPITPLALIRKVFRFDQSSGQRIHHGGSRLNQQIHLALHHVEAAPPNQHANNRCSETGYQNNDSSPVSK
jgi:hypothetical protein